MTRKEHDALQQEMNRIDHYRKLSDRYFKELQDMSRDLGLPVWCSAISNHEQLRDRTEPYTVGGCSCTYGDRARMAYEMYISCNAKEDALTDVALVLSRLGFWKDSDL